MKGGDIINRKFRRAKSSNDFIKFTEYLNSQSIEYAYCKLNKNDYDIFARTSQSDVLLYIEIVALEEKTHCFMKFPYGNNWEDFINNKFNDLLKNLGGCYDQFVYNYGVNSIDLEEVL